MDRYFKFAIQDANDSIMADQEAQNLPSAEQFAQIMNFCAARSIPENDAESNLLNKAVLMFNEENNAKAKLESSEADKASFDLLRSKMEKLEAARKRFETTLGEGQKNQLAKAPNKTEAVLHLIDTATMDWCKSSETGSRTAKSIKNTFNQMCSSIDQHAVLLTMLPKEHEYVTVFFGAFNSIVAASVMHQTMAIGLPRIVDELNLIVADVAKKIGMFPQAKVQIRRTLIELYTRIFNLLADLMEWYRLKRKLMKLLRKDCYGDFEKSLQEIRIWADAVTKEAWNNFAIESRQDSDEHRKTLKRIEEKIEALNSFYQLQADSDTLQASQRVHLMHTDPAAYHDQLAESITTKLLQRFQDMGFSQTLTLASMSAVRSLEFGPSSAATGHNLGTHPPAVQYHPTPSLMSIMSDTTAGAQDSDQGSIESFELPSREEIALYSCVLDNWYNESDIHPLHLRQRPKSPPVMHETITARITEWIKSPQSQALCIQLPYSAGPDSFGGNLASYVVSSAWETNYPIISHFCSLPRGVETGRSPETVALCAMMASFIRQLVVMLPDSLPESAVDLDEARFESLDGTLRTWNEMLSLFAELLTLVEGSKLIVIHGVQLLDHKDTMDPIHEVLALIRENIEDRDRSVKQIIKVLFVTEGQSRAVVPWLDVRRGEHFLFNGVERPRF